MGYLGVILLWFRELSACSQTPLPQLRPGLDLTTSLISCTLRELLFTGMWVRVWRKVNSLKQERIWQPLRRITKRLEWTLLRLREKKAKSTNLKPKYLAVD